jgi:hypothetical protein
MLPRRWPQLLFAISPLPMVALTAFAAWVLFVYLPASHARDADFGVVIVCTAIAYPLTLLMQVGATMGLFRQARDGADEPTPRTKALIAMSFFSLAAPVLVFLAYALIAR